jgi:hypothetical protein
VYGWWVSGEKKEKEGRPTVNAMSRSSRVFRIRSLPSLGTWVSWNARDERSVHIRREGGGRTDLFSEYQSDFTLSIHLSVPNLDQRIVGLSLAEGCRVDAIQYASLGCAECKGGTGKPTLLRTSRRLRVLEDRMRPAFEWLSAHVMWVKDKERY